jgi:hypothetical protein
MKVSEKSVRRLDKDEFWFRTALPANKKAKVNHSVDTAQSRGIGGAGRLGQR